MEITCGQYGDVVPKLVVAAHGDNCPKLQNDCVSEVKQINSDKSTTKYPYIVDPKYLLQDDVNIDNSSYNELLSVHKLEHDIGADDSFYSTWKTMNVSSNDKPAASCKPVSLLIVIGCVEDCVMCSFCRSCHI